MTHEIEIKDTVGCHIRTTKSQAPKEGEAAILKVGNTEVPLRVSFRQETKDSTVSVWLFTLRGSGDCKHLIRNRGKKATLVIGTAAARLAVARRLESLKPKKAVKMKQKSQRSKKAA